MPGLETLFATRIYRASFGTSLAREITRCCVRHEVPVNAAKSNRISVSFNYRRG
jgi:hypothetical protein